MRDSGREFAIHLGRAQIDAMFTRQAAAPLDDSEFLPLLEAMLTAYEKILPDARHEINCSSPINETEPGPALGPGAIAGVL